VAELRAGRTRPARRRRAPRLRRLADEFDEYRRTHGQGDPTRGIHRQDDPATVAEMRRGRSA
jgi:hypothetical protein